MLIIACHSCGDVYTLADEVPPAGNLGVLKVDQTGSASLHTYSEKLKVVNLIGRSVVVSEKGGEKR